MHQQYDFNRSLLTERSITLVLDEGKEYYENSNTHVTHAP
jgi:hypothetical protein